MAAGDPAEKVEVLPAGAVEHELPLASTKLDRLAEVEPHTGEEALLVPANEIRGFVRMRQKRSRCAGAWM